MTFEELNLIEPIMQALKTEGYTSPTPIQAQSIPLILQKRDLLGCAQTGTGKTAAFAIPILQLLHKEKLADPGNKSIKALILTPTRELAIQIDDSFKAYGRGFRSQTIGNIWWCISNTHKPQGLQRGVDILVATPG
jgi:ATP-dependent RNA helicase RhlE